MKNFPIWIGRANLSGSEVGGLEWPVYELIALNINVDRGVNLEGNRLLGSDVNGYKYGEGMEVGIRGSILLETDTGVSDEYLSGYSFLDLNENGSGSNFYFIKIGGNTYERCLINNWTARIEPFLPVVVDFEFNCWDPPTGEAMDVDETGSNHNGVVDLIYGHTSSWVGAEVDDQIGKVKESVTYTENYGVVPVWKLGEIKPSEWFVDTCERQMEIVGTGLSNLINYSGGNLVSAIRLDLNDINGDNISYIDRLGIETDAKVLTQQYNAAGGEEITSSLLIKELII